MLISVASRRLFSSGGRILLAKKAPSMKQVEVDEHHVQEKLGQLQMNFVKKAERLLEKRSNDHVKSRKSEWKIGGTCILIGISIYVYTIFAIKQEKFLDDFEMPDPLLPVQPTSRD